LPLGESTTMKYYFKTFRNLLALAILPFLTGCGGGGALAALGLGSLFGGGGAISSVFGGGGATLALLETSGGGIPVLHNPEPASMILMGTGIAAMAYIRSRK